MIQLPSHARIFVLHEAVSFRNGIDGLTAIARRLIHDDPLDGSYFVFRAKSGFDARVLFFDGLGFWLCTRRLSKGTFKHWPTGDSSNVSAVFSKLLASELMVLLWGGSPRDARFPDLWRQIA